jgi:hypothetical protein
VAVGDRVDQYRALVREAFHDLFDQRKPFGRLALVQVLMLAGSTLVTISLAGSLFFSISPTAAKGKVLLYLLLTIAPFAVVSPLLGPLIDRSRGARRAMVVFSAVGSCAICPLMAMNIHGLLLFPLAFIVLVLSKLYLVTRGALVPEMAAAGAIALPGRAGRDRAAPMPATPGATPGAPAGAPAAPAPGEAGGVIPTTEYAALNARLTLLGTVAGFVASVPGVFFLKVVGGAPAVLVFALFVFAAAAVAGARLPIPRTMRRTRVREWGAAAPQGGAAGPGAGAPVPVAAAPAAAGWQGHDADLAGLQPVAHPEVLFGLTTMSIIRGLGGFLIFMLAFGFRRTHAGLGWYGLALGASGIGAMCGLVLVAPLRRFLTEQRILLGATWLIALGALGAAYLGSREIQAALAFVVGMAGALAQPSFTAIAQHFVPIPAQGRAFARFATRQQLVWVVGALFPVIFAFTFREGDVVMMVVAAAAAVFYMTSRQAMRHRAVPRGHAPPAGDPVPPAG